MPKQAKSIATEAAPAFKWDILRPFVNYKGQRLIDSVTNLVKNMKEMPFYDKPNPPLEELTTKKDDYSTAWSAVKGNRIGAAAELAEAKRQELTAALTLEVNYVADAAPNEMSVTALGLHLRKTQKVRAPVPTDAPKDPAAKDGKSPGEVIFSCEKVLLSGDSSAKVSYNVYEAPSSSSYEGRFVGTGSNSRHISVKGVERLKEKYYYIRATTTAGEGPPSKIIAFAHR